MINKLSICLLGPTCVGKSSVSFKLNDFLPIEIISLDSVMIYKYMNIGSDKPNDRILTDIKHYLINICDPIESYSIFKFCIDSIDILNSCFKRNKIPLFVGGNLMYLWFFQNIFLNKYSYNIKFLNIGIIPIDKFKLKQLIKIRLFNMFKRGFVDEVEFLYNRGNLNLMTSSINSIGYKDLWLYFQNKINFNDVTNNILLSTFNLVEKQEVWLKKWKQNIIYIESDKDKILYNKIYNLIKI